jgi:hypothetical protein
VTDEHLLPDRAQLLREIEQQALRDSQADWDGVAAADAPPQPVHREVDRWVDQQLARVEAARSAAAERGRARIREADAAEAVADEHRRRADAAAADAERHRDVLGAVLRGERRGDDGGDWSDRSRMDEKPRRGQVVDGLVYGAAIVTDVGINYLALRLMGATPLETALLAAAVVLVSVLLPKQLGVMITTARRSGRWSGWPLAAMLTTSGLWVTVLVFVALVRTAYLLLPPRAGAMIGRPALLTVAGISPTTLTVGWLAVALAIGLAVLLRSAHRHNPYVAAWHAAVARAARLVEARSAERAEAERAAEAAARERDVLRAVDDRFLPLAAEYRALGAELKDRYVHALARREGSIEQRGLRGPTRFALTSSVEESAA